MKLASMGLAVALAGLLGWLLLGARMPGLASSGSTVFLPWVMKQATMEEVAIVQREGHKAVYWSVRLTPTLVNLIPIYLEVENRTKRNVTGVTVDFRASDAAGNLITETITQTTTLVDILRPGQRSPVAFYIPFPGGYSAFQSANRDFTLLPNWTYTDNDTQAWLEFSPTYPGAIPTPAARPVAVPTSAPGLGIAQTKIPHSLEGRSACTICHTLGGSGVGAPGGTGMPSDHQGRTDAVCVACHQVGASLNPTPTPTRTVTPTPTPVLSPAFINGWAKNTSQWPVTGASAVVTIRGNEKAYNLVLEATKVPIPSIRPGSWGSFTAHFPRDYGDLYGGYEVILQGGFQAPGLLGGW